MLRRLLLGLLSVACVSLIFSGCSQGSHEQLLQNFTVSGALTGLIAGQQLSLSLDGTDVITITDNGPFTFPVYPTYSGGSYLVVVVTQPSGETCTVGNYTGTVTTNISNVTVLCSPNNYTVSGTVTGLSSGSQFTLQNNGSNTLAITSDGPFQFTTPIAFNSSFNVTVGTQPTGQTCTVSNGSGAAITSNVTNVSVLCSENTFAIGGTLSGLGTSDQVTLLDNGGNSITLNTNGPYVFTTPVAYNGGYNVTVGTQPVGQICSVSNGAGLATVSNITNANVLCSTDTYTIGGAVTGLGTGLQVTLDDNGADPETVDSNTNFTFATPIPYGGQYNVTVGTQPTGQTCTVNNASATSVTANVTNVGVLCAENTYTVGGSVSGLSASGLVLKNNAGDPISVTSGSTSFKFDQPIAYGSGYNVTAFQQPTNQTCNVTNATGNNVMANVTTVQVGCNINLPTAASISPAAGPITGGTSVTITGANFITGATSVTIGGTTVAAASVTVNSSTSLTFTTPAQAAGNVAVTVTTAGGTSSAVSGGFTYDSSPTATSLSPAFGPIAGGTSVTITGTNFISGNTTVTIGGSTVAAASVTVNSATSLTFSTPAGSAGDVAVTVTTPGGTSSAVSGGFTYVGSPTATALSPTFGTIAGGTSVTITGTNFVVGNTTVTIGGTTIPAASVTVNSSTSLTFTTPTSSLGTVAVTVSTSVGTSSAIPGGYTYISSTTLSTSVSSLELMVSGAARQIVITNTGVSAAGNISIGYPTWPSGTTASSTCGSLLSGGSTCSITITPGSNPSSDASSNPCSTGTAPLSLTITVSAANASSVSSTAYVLNYGCLYQGGYIFYFDDTTSATTSTAAKVADTVDTSNGIIWSSDGTSTDFTSIWGIDDTSTISSASPNSSQPIGETATQYGAQQACNGATDGSCNTNNIYIYYNDYSTGSPVPTSDYAAGVCKANQDSGYSDWYLPSVCELGGGGISACSSSSQSIQNELVDTNLLSLNGVYWSSTEVSGNPQNFVNAQYLTTSNSAGQVTASKNNFYAVRCVRQTN